MTEPSVSSTAMTRELGSRGFKEESVFEAVLSRRRADRIDDIADDA